MGSNMKFVDLCQTLGKIKKDKDKDKKLKHLHKLLDYCRQQGSSTNGENSPTLFYQVVRLLLPKLDFERGSYGVKEDKLSKMYCRVLSLGKDNPDANKLTKFRSSGGSSGGDFAEVAYWVLKNRNRDGGVLTVNQVNCYLDNIAKFNAENNPRAQDDELLALVRHTSAEEQKWLIRILLKDLHLELGQVSILNAIHPDARDSYDRSNNLRKVCDTLQDKNKRLHEIDISLFDPCKPMLSDKCNVLTVDTVLKKAPYYFLERKHDGERFQLHMEKGLYRYFSRKGYVYTDSFGATSDVGILTPQLSKQLRSDIRSCILDGEMMGWSKQWQCFASKGTVMPEGTFDVKKLQESSKYQPCFCVFDVLLLNGEILTNKPLKERLETLSELFTPLKGVFMDTRRKVVTTSAEVVDALNYAIDNQEEGLILKHPLSIYKPAAHKGGWYKIKPEFTDNLNDDLDLLIIGGLYENGRHSGDITHFLLGVAVPPQVEGTDPTEFHSVCRVGSGYSRVELGELLLKLKPYWNHVKPGCMPPGLKWTKEKPDLWIPPCHSQILQVKAAEIQISDKYKTGYTLRFPRVVCIRYDKKWSECLSTDGFNELRLQNKGKLALKHVNVDDVGSTSPQKRPRLKVAQTVGQAYRPADTTNVAQTGTRFLGKEIVVMSGNAVASKMDLEKRIVSEGGTVVQNRGPDTFCVVVGEQNAKFKFVAASKEVDVVSVDRFLKFLDGQESQWTPHDLLSMSAKTEEEMKLKYDKFYDSFLQPTDVDTLKLSLNKVAEMGAVVNLLPSEMADHDEYLFSGPNEYAIFRCCVAFLLKSESLSIARECDMLGLMFCFQGGRVSDSLTSDVTHVVVHPQDIEKHKYIFEKNHLRPKKFHLVTYDWIDSCWKVRHRLLEIDFHPKSPVYCSDI